MKNTDLIVVLILGAIIQFCAACAKDISVTDSNMQAEEEIDIVERGANDMFSFFGRKACVGCKSTCETIEVIEDSLYSVVQFPCGYSVYANDSSTDLIAISECGQYGMDVTHEEYVRALNSIANSLINEDPDYEPLQTTGIIRRYQEVTTVSDSLLPMIDVHWHQHEPFSRYATNPSPYPKLAGCSMVAIAQIMAYFQQPSILDLSFEDAPYSQINLDWANMKSHTSDHGEQCEYCEQNACLLRQIGEICEANYNSSGTGAWPYVEYLNTLGYTGTEYSGYSHNVIMSSLRAGYPCIISGFEDSPEGSSGHSWDVDGYRNTVKTTTNYRQEEGSFPVIELKTVLTTTYLHFNYGWGGSSDGYLLSYKKETASGLVIDGGFREDIIIPQYSNSYPDVRLLVARIRPVSNN